MATTDPEPELDKLILGLRQEILWLISFALLRNARVYRKRKDLKKLGEGAYLLVNKVTGEPRYAGSTNDLRQRQYNQELFKELGEKYYIIVFEFKHQPLVFRQALEAFLKLLVWPEDSHDKDKAHMTEEYINALRYLIHEAIKDTDEKVIKGLLQHRHRLPKLKKVASGWHTNWETEPGAKSKIVITIIEAQDELDELISAEFIVALEEVAVSG